MWMAVPAPPVTSVVDIACPVCERVGPVVKLSIDRYRCGDCEHEFTADDVTP